MTRPRGLPAWLIVKETDGAAWMLALPLLSAGADWTDVPVVTAHFFSRAAAARRLRELPADTRRGARIVPIWFTG